LSVAAPNHLSIGPDEVAGNGGRGRFFLLPGSDARARQMAENFSDLRVYESPRQLNVYLGTVVHEGRRIDVGSVPTGMGTPSVDIVVTELIQRGARRLLRVGTAGSLQPDIVRPGDLVIATAAVRDESTSQAYAPLEVPAMAHPDWVAALTAAAKVENMAARSFAGCVHTKDSLFAREFGQGPLAGAHKSYVATLTALGVLASEMEAAHLFVLGAVHGNNAVSVEGVSATPDVIKCGALLAVIGGESSEKAAVTERKAVDVALRALAELFLAEDFGAFSRP